MTCPKCEALLQRLSKLRDRKDWYVTENKRLRAKVRNQAKTINELEDILRGRRD